jgi:hypothetical protein
MGRWGFLGWLQLMLIQSILGLSWESFCGLDSDGSSAWGCSLG